MSMRYIQNFGRIFTKPKNGKDFLCINFIDLVSNTEEILPKYLNF